MATNKQLIVAVEGTAELGPHWKTILSNYLNKIIKSIHDSNQSEATLELAFVVFGSHGPYSSFLVQRSGWIKDLDVFLQLLSGVEFSGGGGSGAAIAEGLSEALVMFGMQFSENAEIRKHCILVAASNPHLVPTLVNMPIENSEQTELPENLLLQARFVEAEAVVKALSRCSVSLSVISPRQLPKLRELYNAGQCNPRGPDPVVHHTDNPYFLISLSDDLMEALGTVNTPQLVPAPAPAPAPSNKWVQIWEGGLFGHKQGNPCFICKLQGYKKMSSERSAANWPQAMQILRLVAKDNMDAKLDPNTVEQLILHPPGPHKFFVEVYEKQLYMVVQLPSNTLLLSLPKKESKFLIGFLVPQQMVMKEPSRQQPQQSHSRQQNSHDSHGNK